MATFGQTGDSAGATTSSADSALMNKAADAESTPASNGTLISVVARVWLSAGSTLAKGIIYSEAGNLIATGDEVTVSNTAEAEVTFPFSGAEQIALVAGTKYNYGIIFNDPGAGNMTWSRGATAAASWKYSDTYEDGPAATIGSGTVSGPVDIYVNYTPTASTSIKKVSGVTYATIKKVSGVVIASVKKIAGLA